MKKILVILSFSTVVISCGNNNNETKTEPAPEVKTEAPPAVDPDIEKGADLVAKSDCLTCHRVAEKLVGPAYQSVAQKYQLTDQVLDTLSEKIIKGGAGRWGAVPMTPHPQISKEDAKIMVKYVLSLKNQ